MNRPPRILFACGGTGGHVYPAIAIADAVRERIPDAAIAFAGTKDRMEWEAVPKAGYPIHPITVSGFQRRLSLRTLSFPFKLLLGALQSWRLVRGFDADVVVGTGGYVSGPVVLMGHLHGRRTLIQEQNAFPGVTNRLLGRVVDRIHVAFPEAKEHFPSEKCVLTGNPTRAVLRQAERAAARSHFDLPEDAHVLFVFGGSLGSEALNDAVERFHEELLQDEKTFVIWQTGSRYFDAIKRRLTPHPRLRPMKYVDRMDLAYAASDLVLSRAGAITCSELMVTGTPAVLVPSPHVVADHQTRNAESLSSCGAARLLPEPELSERLVSVVRELFDDEAGRLEMGEAALERARADAADQIADDILRLAADTTTD